MRAVWLVIGCAACGGGGSSEPAPVPVVPAISIVAPPASTGDLEVARVDGHPVWGSCVAEQVARGATTRQAALDECIAFELMARAAEQKGLGTDREVADATRIEMVSRLIDTSFEAVYQKPADLGDHLTKWLGANQWRQHRPELRGSAYVRVKLARTAAPADDAKARALAEKIATALAGETGLTTAHLRELAEPIAEGSGLSLDIADVGNKAEPGLDPSYGKTLFALTEVGRTSPAVRTPWGWDVVLLTSVTPAREFTPDEVAADAFGELRRSMFQVWINKIIKEHRIKIEIDPAQVARLESAS